jgi:hypothetical protein
MLRALEGAGKAKGRFPISMCLSMKEALHHYPVSLFPLLPPVSAARIIVEQ